MESITTAKGREKAAKLSKAMGKASEHYGNNAIDNAVRAVFGKNKKSSSGGGDKADPRVVARQGSTYQSPDEKTRSKRRAAYQATVTRARASGQSIPDNQGRTYRKGGR